MTFALVSPFNRAPVQNFLIERIDLLVADEARLVCNRWPRFLIESGENEVRPCVALRFGVAEQTHAAVWMCAMFIASERWRAKNFTQPAKVNSARERIGNAAAPNPAQSLGLAPALCPTELRKNPPRLR